MKRHEGNVVEVLYVDADTAARERIASANDEEVLTVASAEAAMDHLGAADCLVVADDIEDGDPLELVETARQRDADLPIVLYPRETREDFLRNASRFGPTACLPQEGTASDAELFDQVRDAIHTREHTQQLEQHADLLATIQEHLAVSAYVKDAEARFIWATDNEDAPDPEDMIGKTDREVYPEFEVSQTSYEDDMQVIETGEPIIEKEERIAGEGWELWLETTKAPWFDENGDVGGLVGTTLDINDRKQLERDLDQETQSLERLFSYISHDLRNPLNVAKGYLELARMEEPPADQTIDNIADGLSRIEEIIDDVVTLASEEGITLENPIQLGETLTNAWGTGERTDATLRSEIPQRALIVAAETQLQQLLENLFRNAIDHVGPNVTVDVGLLEEGFYVADDGPGITEADREAVLEYGQTTKDGPGAGLAIVSDIADLHDWTVEITESASSGTRVEIGNCLLVPHPEQLVESGVPVELEDSIDIGDPQPGETRRDDDSWVITAGGENVWGEHDDHHFAYTTVDGDARIVAQVTHLDGVHEYSKAGVMIRDGLEAGTPLGHTGITDDYGSEVLWRPGPEEAIHSKFPNDETEPPYWYRLDRVGNVVTCSISPDGENWRPIDQHEVALQDPIHLGLAVCSHDVGSRCTARFDNVSVLVAEN